jgi:hypothetical protein
VDSIKLKQVLLPRPMTIFGRTTQTITLGENGTHEISRLEYQEDRRLIVVASPIKGTVLIPLEAINWMEPLKDSEAGNYAIRTIEQKAQDEEVKRLEIAKAIEEENARIKAIAAAAVSPRGPTAEEAERIRAEYKAMYSTAGETTPWPANVTPPLTEAEKRAMGLEVQKRELTLNALPDKPKATIEFSSTYEPPEPYEGTKEELAAAIERGKNIIAKRKRGRPKKSAKPSAT